MCAYQRKRVAQVDNNVLAKVVEAVRRWLEGLCDQCADVENCEFCRLDSLKYETRPLEDLARAVLEAAGVIGEGCVAPDVAKCNLSPYAGCGACPLRSNAALARAGKEA